MPTIAENSHIYKLILKRINIEKVGIITKKLNYVISNCKGYDLLKQTNQFGNF